MSKREALTGRWEGSFRYSAAPENGDFPFKARLSEKGGVLTGLTVEELPSDMGLIKADITGSVAGDIVTFEKTYIGLIEQEGIVILYEGNLSAAGDRITGTWTRPDDRGTFAMERK